MKWKKILDCICFMGGPFVLALGLAGFYYTNLGGGWSGWDDTDKFRIGLGVALICFGFLRKHWEKSYRQPNKES